MGDQEENIKRTVKILCYTTIAIGSSVIFLMASLTHHYIGAEGEVWFQMYGVFTGAIIAHYVWRQMRFMKEGEEKDDDVQE